jgi:hypothetical protein
MNDWLIIYGFTSRSRIFHLYGYGDVTTSGEGLQKFRPMLCAPGLWAGSVSCHTCCDTEPRFFGSHPKDDRIQSLLTTHEGMWRIYSNPDPQGLSNRNAHLVHVYIKMGIVLDLVFHSKIRFLHSYWTLLPQTVEADTNTHQIICALHY